MNTHQPLTGDSAVVKILAVTFNQDESCFSVAHEKGFHVYSSDPLDVRVKRDFSKGGNGSGIGVVGMLHRTNYLALVGGGRRPRFPNTRVVVWDDLKRKASLSLDFMLPVLSVSLSRVKIVVALENQVLVYGFSSPPRKLAVYDSHNPRGLIQMASHMDGQTLAFPARQSGQIQIVDIPSGQERSTAQIIRAHKAAIRCIALSRSCQFVASASETGTIIRVHSTRNTALAYEFRRGLDKAVITSMSFSPDDSRLAVLSDRGTLHIFNVGDEQNRQHILRKLPVIPTYFKSVWSFCSAAAGGDSFDKGVLGWSGNDSVLIIWNERRIWEKWVIYEKRDETSTWVLEREAWNHLLEDGN